MTRISDRFLQLGVIAALIGMAMGAAMGATKDFTLAPAHAHLNLLGWVSMMIYGLFYRAVPSAAQGRLAAAQFWLAVAGVLVLVPSLVLELMGRREAEAGLAVGSVITLVSMVLFAAVVFGATRRRPVQLG
jgi:cbb3-type cytochrome oxidase subunit 1